MRYDGDRRFKKQDWQVFDAPFDEARDMVAKHHYAKGAGKVSVFTHGLYYKGWRLMGVAIWIPPTGPAAKSVNESEWAKVLSLTRLVILPRVPKNACSFLLANSTRLIKTDGRFVSLVTYADEAQGHLGTIYKASNWSYMGKTKPTPRWQDIDGKQVSPKATWNRTKTEMLALGYIQLPPSCKHKFVKHL